jgi:hypothetical protein
MLSAENQRPLRLRLIENNKTQVCEYITTFFYGLINP